METHLHTRKKSVLEMERYPSKNVAGINMDKYGPHAH